MVTIVVYILLLIALTPPLGAYMYRVYKREEIGRAEGIVYRLVGVNPSVEQSWRRYATSCLWFSVLSMVVLYALFRLQNHLPLNPVGLGAVDNYVVVQHLLELHHQHELAGLRRRDHDELPQPDARVDLPELRLGGGRDGRRWSPCSAGSSGPRADEVGNFWRDLVRGTIYVLLPSRSIVAVLLVTQGVVQTLGSYRRRQPAPRVRADDRPGPGRRPDRHQAARDERRRVLQRELRAPVRGRAPLATSSRCSRSSSSRPPSRYTFGKWVGNIRQGWALFAAMMLVLWSPVA